eukprot:TRINITY_DN30419_c0_g1_i1.p1 TRINITY_DN30419_c0_g1~~TRINITY_DN30419_c0_g1_i1.p1  ORF type:complete len:577 (+),score=181.42 TRINITY_DN30419_c0_g1_i1:85-1815(+)
MQSGLVVPELEGAEMLVTEDDSGSTGSPHGTPRSRRGRKQRDRPRVVDHHRQREREEFERYEQRKFREYRQRGKERTQSRREARLLGTFLGGLMLGWVFIHYGLRIGTDEVLHHTAGGHGGVVRDGFYVDKDAETLRQLRRELAVANQHIGDLQQAAIGKAVNPQLDVHAQHDGHDASVEEVLGVSRRRETPAPAAKFIARPRDPLTYSLDNLLSKAVNNTIVLSFCSVKYLDPMVNWLGLLVKHGITNWGVVCLDNELREWLRAHNTECGFVLKGWKHGVWDPEETATQAYNPGKQLLWDGPMPLAKCKQSCEYDIECAAVNFKAKDRMCSKAYGGFVKDAGVDGVEHHLKRTTSTLWFARWKLLVRLLDAGVHVVMGDLDAIFLRNPLQYINHMPPADLIGQRGSFPPWLTEKWGAALCMGFVMWRSTPATRRFTVHMHKVITKTGDDQIGVNVALDQVNTVWDEGRLTYADSEQVSYGWAGGSLRVALLPHTQFPRRCDEIPIDTFKANVVMAHCYESKKDGEAKKKKAIQYGLWVIHDDWTTFPILPDFEDFIRSITVDYATQPAIAPPPAA